MKPFNCCFLLLLLLTGSSAFAQQPFISSFSPLSGTIGTTVSITGNNFNTITANNTVYFGATKAVVISSSATLLTVKVPTGATYDKLKVTTNGHTAQSSGIFTVISGLPITANSFPTKIDFPTQAVYPSLISRKDFDQDGKPDMVVSDFNSNNISVYRNTSTTGTVSFAPVANYPCHFQPESISTDDIDGDGKPDITINSIDEHLFSVFINTSTTGNISFSNRQDFPQGNLYWPRGILTADMDADGLTDVITMDNNMVFEANNTSHGNVTIHKNTGTPGALSFNASASFFTTTYPREGAIGDFNGDNKPDLAVSFSGQNIIVFTNNTVAGAMDFSQQTLILPVIQPGLLEAGDLDGDGKTDLIVSGLSVINGPAALFIFKNTSTGNLISFAVPQSVPLPAPFGFSLGDIDGDGKPDLTVANISPGQISVLKNTSVVNNISFAAAINFDVSNGLLDAKLGDVDGDNLPDITATDPVNNKVWVLRMTGENPLLDLGNDTTICEGDSVVLNANVNNAQFLWSTNATNNTITVKQSGTYWVRATTPTTVLSDTIRIHVNPQPVVDLGDDVKLCKGNSINLNAFNQDATYAWSNGSSLSSLHITQGGTYSVAVNLDGCIQKDTVNITYDSLPSFTLGPDAILCKDNKIILDPKLSNVNFRWQDGSTAPAYTVTNAGTYSLTINNDCGTASDQVVIEDGLCELFMPNAFTPNGNGTNDRFGVKYFSFIKKFEMKIFNRWGNIIFQTTDPAKSWDGTYKGFTQPTGNYIWTINLTDIFDKSSFHAGSVLLIR